MEGAAQQVDQPLGRTNRLAVIALVCACLAPLFAGGILATVLGSRALDELDEVEDRERGRGMAQLVIALGFVNIALSCVLVVSLVAILS